MVRYSYRTRNITYFNLSPLYFGLSMINLFTNVACQLVQGLDFVLPLMDLEEESEVIIGPRFAFGSEGRKPDIPPDATLHYTVTLLSADVEPAVETLSLDQRKSVG